MKCHFEPKSRSTRTTPKLEVTGRLIGARRPWVFKVSPALGSFGIGICVFQIFWTRVLNPMPRGSHGPPWQVAKGPTLGLKLYCVTVPLLLICTIPWRRRAEGTSLSIVVLNG